MDGRAEDQVGSKIDKLPPTPFFPNYFSSDSPQSELSGSHFQQFLSLSSSVPDNSYFFPTFHSEPATTRLFKLYQDLLPFLPPFSFSSSSDLRVWWEENRKRSVFFHYHRLHLFQQLQSKMNERLSYGKSKASNPMLNNVGI